MQKIAIKYGLQMFLSLVALFVVVHILGQSQNYHLRVLNGFIHLTFLYLAIRAYRRLNPTSVHNYVSGVGMGFYMSIVAIIPFGISVMVYLVLNESFFESIRSNFPYPEMLTPWTAVIAIVVEGIATTVIGAYIVTRVIDGLLEEAK